MRFFGAIALVAALAFPFAGRAQGAVRTQGFVGIAPGRSLYVDYIRPAEGMPTVVLVNGLTYRTGAGCWEAFANQLESRGYGVFMWDPVGMGQTLLRDLAPVAAIDYRGQVNDMSLLLDRVGIAGPLNIVGLSYGGGLAIAFAASVPASRIGTVTLMSPYTERVAGQENWIQKQIAQTHALFPLNPASNADLYDYFLRAVVYGTFPSVEPIVLENPYKLEAVFRLSQGLESFDASEYVGRLPASSIHLLIARQDQYIANGVLDAFWETIPLAARLSRLYVEESEHKIPEAVPAFAASLMDLILNHDQALSGGRTFTASPSQNTLQEIDHAARAP